ncbi:DUF2388 domain-containing protein [Pseudomonas chlororaphis]|uniref:Holliday junction resolvasome, helicase subunit n=1 Tax=Pseudomonas chlororaphis TaxID=587753 RepID=A0A1Q8EQA7_9PSED|nr:DUF2388 domain-containing protein [Pseudomonas chlororaphis]OLF53984.1 hypothetical protein BTN82_13060 [Pseudomonas chlororaphis]
MTPRKTRLPLLLCACLLASVGQATSLVISTDIGMSLTLSSTRNTANLSGSFKDDKRVLAAKTDAAAFVASAGDIRGAQLETALRHIRQRFEAAPYSDLQLASAILTL